MDGRYVAVATDVIEAAGLAEVRVERVERRYDATLAAVLTRLKVARAGFEAEHVTIATLGMWERAAGSIAWQPTERVVEGHRTIKDDFEIGVFRRAARALSDVAREAGAWVRAGRTEIDVARDIDAAIDRAGFSAPAFPTIVASGQRRQGWRRWWPEVGPAWPWRWPRDRKSHESGRHGCRCPSG